METRQSRFGRNVALGAIVVLATASSGCMRMGPKVVVRDHTQYATAVGDSWKTEALTNIVRLRYADWPVFRVLPLTYDEDGRLFHTKRARTGDTERSRSG